MYCQNCGKRCESDSVFCQFCGVRIEDDQPDQYVPTQYELLCYRIMQIKEWLGPRWGIVWKLGLAACILILFLLIGSSVSDPQAIAERYFKAVMKENWNQVYDLIVIPEDESEFLNESAFGRYARNNLAVEDNEYTSYQVLGSREQDGITLQYTIQYGTDSTPSTNLTVTLQKQDKKSWIFFDSYKVYISNLTASGVTITTLPGSEVYLDDELIPQDVSVSSGNLVEYNMDTLFSGMYTIEVRHPGCYDDLNAGEEFYIENGDQFNFVDREISSGQEAAMHSDAEQWIRSIFSSVSDGQAFQVPSGELELSARALEQLESIAENMADRFKASGVTLTDYVLSDFEYSNSSRLNDGVMDLWVSYYCEYTYQYTDEQGNLSEESDWEWCDASFVFYMGPECLTLDLVEMMDVFGLQYNYNA